MNGAPGVRAIIFDLGGVILRTDNPLPRSQLAERVGLTRAALEEVVFGNPVAQQAERGMATADEIWAEVARQLGLPPEEMPAFSRQFFGGDQVDFALVELIQKLRASCTTALLSNSWYVDLPRFLKEDLQIPDTFDIVISSAQQRLAKPDPGIFRLALEMVKARPEEAVFVDDFQRNIEAARSVGLRTIHFRSTEQVRKELLELVQTPL